MTEETTEEMPPTEPAPPEAGPEECPITQKELGQFLYYHAGEVNALVRTMPIDRMAERLAMATRIIFDVAAEIRNEKTTTDLANDAQLQGVSPGESAHQISEILDARVRLARRELQVEERSVYCDLPSPEKTGRPRDRATAVIWTTGDKGPDHRLGATDEDPCFCVLCAQTRVRGTMISEQRVVELFQELREDARKELGPEMVGSVSFLKNISIEHLFALAPYVRLLGYRSVQECASAGSLVSAFTFLQDGMMARVRVIDELRTNAKAYAPRSEVGP